MTESTGEAIRLREISSATLLGILELEVAEHQRGFVATNAESIAEAHFSELAWFRGIYAEETPVGFVMLSVNPQGPKGEPEYSLWRFMIGQNHQGRGYGRRALELVIEHVRGLPGARELTLSYVPGEGEPRGFYERLGFAETGEVDGRERVMRRAL